MAERNLQKELIELMIELVSSKPSTWKQVEGMFRNEDDFYKWKLEKVVDK